MKKTKPQQVEYKINGVTVYLTVYDKKLSELEHLIGNLEVFDTEKMGKGVRVKKKPIKKGELALFSDGNLMFRKDMSENQLEYSLIFDDKLEIDIDLYSAMNDKTKKSMIAGRINQSCYDNNIYPDSFYITTDGVPVLLFYSLVDIYPGSELYFDYMRDQCESRGCIHKCGCPSKNCRGYTCRNGKRNMKTRLLELDESKPPYYYNESYVLNKLHKKSQQIHNKFPKGMKGFILDVMMKKIVFEVYKEKCVIIGEINHEQEESYSFIIKNSKGKFLMKFFYGSNIQKKVFRSKIVNNLCIGNKVGLPTLITSTNIININSNIALDKYIALTYQYNGEQYGQCVIKEKYQNNVLSQMYLQMLFMSINLIEIGFPYKSRFVLLPDEILGIKATLIFMSDYGISKKTFDYDMIAYNTKSKLFKEDVILNKESEELSILLINEKKKQNELFYDIVDDFIKKKYIQNSMIHGEKKTKYDSKIGFEDYSEYITKLERSIEKKNIITDDDKLLMFEVKCVKEFRSISILDHYIHHDLLKLIIKLKIADTHIVNTKIGDYLTNDLFNSYYIDEIRTNENPIYPFIDIYQRKKEAIVKYNNNKLAFDEIPLELYSKQLVLHILKDAKDGGYLKHAIKVIPHNFLRNKDVIDYINEEYLKDHINWNYAFKYVKGFLDYYRKTKETKEKMDEQ